MIHKFSRYLLTLVALLTMTTGAWADELSESFTTNTGATVYTGEHFKITVDAEGDGDGFTLRQTPPKNATIEALNGETITKVEFTRGWDDITSFSCEVGTTTFSGDVATVSGVNNTSLTVSATNSLQIKAVKVYYTAAPAGPVVEISDDQTSAEFDMPSYDATLEYDIVRNMASNMTVSIGDGQDGYRIRVKKQGESFVPAEMTLQQMMALYTVHDATEQKDLLFYGDGKVCDISIFAVDDQGQPTGQAIAFTALTPGRYVAIATAPDDSPLYAGQTPQSNIFVLYQGYEVTVPAGEYITYYKEENLYVENENAKLYTITDVSETTATATELTVVPALTPILVQNTAQTPQTILLIPTTDKTPDAVEAYTGFIVTLEATQIAASDATADRYAFNGKQFVWVKTALAVAANKAWLEVPTGANARVINLVFGDATGVNAVESGKLKVESLYDLNGRKLQGIPTKKGVYIMNGKKVVVK